MDNLFFGSNEGKSSQKAKLTNNNMGLWLSHKRWSVFLIWTTVFLMVFKRFHTFNHVRIHVQLE